MGRVRGGRGGKRHTASKWSPCQLLTCKGSYCTLLSLHVLHWKTESVVIFVSLGYSKDSVQSVQLLSCVRLFPTPQTATRQASLSPCPSPTPGVYSNSCPLSQWHHPTISSSVIPFSSHLQSFPATGSFQMSQLFASGGQSIGVSASTSVLPMNVQD